MRSGLRFRVTAVTTLVVLVVLTGAAAALVATQRSLLIESLQDEIELEADELADRLRDGEILRADDLRLDDMVAQIVDGQGEVVAASAVIATAPAWPANGRGSETWRTVSVDALGGPARLLSRSVGSTDLHVAGSRVEVDESITGLVRSLVVLVPVVTVVLAVIVWWSVGRALRPVEAIRSTVERIGESHLDQRVPEPGTDDEVARLARTMNQLLARLDTAAARQRRFVADAAHELRSPLARIRSEVEVDLAHPETADPPRTARRVRDETTTMQHLVDDLLMLARGDAGPRPLGRQRVDVGGVVNDLADGLRRRSSLEVDTTGVGAVFVDGDPELLARAIANLVDNAQRHARRRVTLGVDDSGDSVVVTVEDDGPGIPPDHLDDVFERFTRLDSARAEADGGSGLGLPIARGIAERHGGSLVVDPASAHGARFVLTVPARRRSSGS